MEKQNDALTENTNDVMQETNGEKTAEQMSDAASQARTDSAVATNADCKEPFAVSKSEAAEPFLTVRYNHRNMGLTQKEAAALAQKGMKFERVLNKLDYIAAQQEISIDAVVDGVLQSMEDEKRAELQQRYGEDETKVNELMELYRFGQREKYERVKADNERKEKESETGVIERIAEEFRTMKKDFPELSDFDLLPDKVKQAALDGTPLAFAYLMYQHTERRKAHSAELAAADAALKSVGSMAGCGDDTDNNDGRKYRNALWGN